MYKSTQLPVSMHGYDMFFERISQKNLEKIALTQGGVFSTDPGIKKVICKLSQPVDVNDENGLLAILFAVRVSGEQIAKDYGAIYSGGELYITGVCAKSSSLEELFP
jgi:hypothetical protein